MLADPLRAGPAAGPLALAALGLLLGVAGSAACRILEGRPRRW